MNRQLINEFGQNILCYRLRTKRHKIRMQYEDFDKQLLKMGREQTALYRKQRNLGWEPLVPPVQKGWKRVFVLRNDVAESKYAAFFEGILQKINTKDWSSRKDFLVRRRKFGRKIYVLKPQYLKKLDLWEWRKAAFNEAEQQFFECVFSIDKSGYIIQQYVFAEPWRFVLKTSPNIIDKVRTRDVVIEQRLKEIDNYLTRNDYKKRMCKIAYGGNKWRDRSKPGAEKYRFENKPVEQLLYELYEEAQ
jgi:hypothetical protein